MVRREEGKTAAVAVAEPAEESSILSTDRAIEARRGSLKAFAISLLERRGSQRSNKQCSPKPGSSYQEEFFDRQFAKSSTEEGVEQESKPIPKPRTRLSSKKHTPDLAQVSSVVKAIAPILSPAFAKATLDLEAMPSEGLKTARLRNGGMKNGKKTDVLDVNDILQISQV